MSAPQTPAVRAVVTSQSDMMVNYQASSPVSCEKPIGAVLDANGNPAIISIGTDDELWIIYRDPASTTGWTQRDLTTGLAPGIAVLTVATTQIAAGQFCIAIAVAASSGQTSTPVYITDWLANDLPSIDWSGFAQSRWVLRAPTEPVDSKNLAAGTQPVQNVTVERILMGATNSTSKPPLVVVAGAQQGTDRHWFINGSVSDGSWSWADYPMPEDADQILDLCVGYLSQGLGTYVLYTIGTATNLIFTTATLPGSGATLPYTHFLTAPAGARCIAALPDPSSHFTNLFVAGSGVSYFDFSTQPMKPPMGSVGIQIVTPAQLSNVQQIVVAQDKHNVSLWVLDRATQNLSYTTGPQNSKAGSAWTEPLVLQAHVAHLAALRHPQLEANQIVTALSDNSLAYQWQDPATTLWRSSNVPLSDLVDDPIHQFSSYTSHIHVADDKGGALSGAEVSITSSQWAYVTINGYSYELGPSTPAKVKTDVMGNVTIIAQTASIGTPVYQVGRAEGPLVVDPASNAIATLGRIQTGADLQAVTLPNGNKLLSASTSQDTADLGALCIKNLVSYGSTLPADGTSIPDSDDGTTAPEQSFGGTLDDGKMQPYTVAAKFDLGSAIEGVVGDVLKFVHTEIKRIEAFVFSVAKGVIRFAVMVAGKWICIALRALGDVLEAINWVLNLLGLSLQEILQWLGLDFGWSEVLKTSAVLNNLAQQTYEMFAASTVTIQKKIDDGFETILREIDNVGKNQLLPADVAATNVADAARSAQASSSQAQSGSSFLTSSAGGNFIYYHSLHSGVLSSPAPGASSGPSAIADYFKNTVLPALTEVSEEVLTAIQTLLTGFQQGTLTIGEIIGVITKTLVEVTTEVLQVMIDGFFALLETVLGLGRAILFTPIDIPFLTPLYKLLTGADSLTLMSGFALLAAIPSTIGYRIVKGSAPFATTTYGLDTATWQQLFPTLQQSGLPTLMLAAGTSHGEFSEARKIYSEIGGLVSLVLGLLAEVCTGVEAVSQGVLGTVASVASTVIAVINSASTFPFDTNKGQEAVAFIVWFLQLMEIGLVLSKYCTPLGADESPYTPKSGPLAGHMLASWLEVAKGGYEIILGLFTLVCDALSFIAEMVKDDPDDRPLDVMKFIQNFGAAVTTIANGVAGVAGKKDVEVIVIALLTAGIAEVASFLLGTARACDAIIEDILYQPS